MEHPKTVGDRSTLAVTLALRDAGFGIYVPFGENTRVDLIIEDGERLAQYEIARVAIRSTKLRGDPSGESGSSA